jgi:hypothetical protein
MRSHHHTATPHAPPPETHPVRSARRTGSRSRSGSGRRRRARPAAPPEEPMLALVGSPEALYRAEKARRASNVDASIMAEAKRLYDEAVAETGKKRAGMRSAVIPPSQRRGANAPIAAVGNADVELDAEA